MARAKEFDTTHALAKAMSVFWRHGYEHTSTAMLTREMGIAKQSLYDTFGNKRSLYLKALIYYRDRTNADARKRLRSEPSVKRGFAKILFGLSSETREQHERGCLLLSANLERDTRDAAISAILRENRAQVESIFLEALRRAHATGELPRAQDPAALARFFIATIQGMRAMARLQSDRGTLRQVAKVALASFDRRK